MNILLWIIQVLLAAMFVFHGRLFIAPPAEMVEIMNAEYAPWFRILIGVSELLGAAGLILPGLLRIWPWLTVAAASGLAVVVGSATVYHLIRGEINNAAVTALLCLLCVFVAYMRWQVKPIAPRNIASQNVA